MPTFPQIFTFYSYKGGVGRSMAALNCAYELAHRGRSVLLVDMDLEAPGLSGFLTRNREISWREGQRDVVDLVGWAIDRYHDDPTAESRDEVVLRKPPPLKEFAARVPPSKIVAPEAGQKGRIDVIGANEADPSFQLRLERLGLGTLRRDDLIGIGRVLGRWFQTHRRSQQWPKFYPKETWPRSVPYDYVLVDSRTGFTEAGGLCIGPMCDWLVVVTGLNDQNLHGTKRFLEMVGIQVGQAVEGSEPDLPRLGPKKTMLVASLLPAGEIAYKEERLDEAQRLVGPVAARLSYHPQMALMESIFVREHPRETLAVEYKSLVSRLMTGARDSSSFLAMASRILQGLERWEAAVQAALRMLPDEPTLGYATLVALQHQLRFNEVEAPASTFAIASALLSAESAAVRAEANYTRGVVLGEAGHDEAAVAAYDAALDSQDAPPETKARALCNRAAIRSNAGDPKGAIPDFEAALECADSESEPFFKSLEGLAVSLGRCGRIPAALEAYSRLLNIPNLPIEIESSSRLGRSSLLIEYGQVALAIEDCSVVLALPDVPLRQRIGALLNRGDAHRKAHNYADAIADYSSAIGTPGVAGDQLAGGLANRALTNVLLKDWTAAIADADAVLELSDGPDEPRAWALHGRALARLQTGDKSGGVADLEALLANSETPIDLRSRTEQMLAALS